jgi:diguanylate cyclase (GGDEF)-like protein
MIAQISYDVLAWAAQFRVPLVLLALLVCAAGSFTVVVCVGCAMAAPAPAKKWWLIAVSISFGADVWATHFIAMLAFNPGLPLCYGVGRTVASIFIAIAGSVPPFAMIICQPGRRGVVAAGVLLGLTIAAMHFTGMSAMLICGQPAYNPICVAGAILFGTWMAGLSCHYLSQPKQRFSQTRAVLFLILAIGGLHFIAMGGFSIRLAAPMADLVALRQSAIAASADFCWLAVSVAGVSSLIMLASCSAALVNRRIGAIHAREAASLRHIARHDDLTGLPNRLWVREWLVDALDKPRDTWDFALLFMALDRFKPVNDLFGHQVGDLLLVQVAARIGRLVNESIAVARFGGDEFIILLRRGVGFPFGAAELGKTLLQAMEEPFVIDSHSLHIGASIGIAFGPERGMDVEAILRRADTALYHAKAQGGGRFCFFEMGMAEELLARQQIECDFEQAIEDQQFAVYYQPLFQCDSSTLCGFEALVRWIHPTRGLISPADFIPFAEKSGLIRRLGIWVLETACLAAMNWPEGLRVSVNLSPVQLRDAGLVDTIRAVLERTGLTPDRLEFEITESALIEDPDRTEAVLRVLKKDGVQFAIDDFGTGYSSLSYLRRFPFDRIKIDRSFVKNLTSDADSATIVRAIVGLGHSLGISVLAEGVETQWQLKLLREQHCDRVQGYLLGRPMPQDRVADFIATQGAKADGSVTRLAVG